MKVALLNAAFNADYVYGIVSGLAVQRGVEIEVIDTEQSSWLYSEFPNVRVLPFLGRHGSKVGRFYKVWRHIRYYVDLLRWAIRTDAKIVHIQWLNRFETFERFFVLPFLKLLRKRLVYTAHNVDTKARNSGQSGILTRLSLRFMYRRMDRVIAHASSIRTELMQHFGVPEDRIRVIPHPLNVLAPEAAIDRTEARARYSLQREDKVVLLFGNLDPYKGVDVLIQSIALSRSKGFEVQAIIAGSASQGAAEQLKRIIRDAGVEDCIRLRTGFLPTEQFPVLFAASDCVVLPYHRISQSGVPFTAYRYGVPVIATRVGGLPEAVLEGVSGMLYSAGADPGASLCDTLHRFFASDLFHQRAAARARIQNWAEREFSPAVIGESTMAAYRDCLSKGSAA